MALESGTRSQKWVQDCFKKKILSVNIALTLSLLLRNSSFWSSIRGLKSVGISSETPGETPGDYRLLK